ncbi:hypothetical protein [Parasulfitobacter algicola]|uniref:Uncharacterized protein n=1 Tax=Parasulfitobacter algicola TaxID=2614809 RepID=A0ABX2IZ48_9RHOB|nr:hypothetical protein [Sulfitobacter algicola]NSX56482.1 hypothetical protein [Sulfitobacter algicola]
MKKVTLISLLVFIGALILGRYCLVEIWRIEDNYWKPDGSNLQQGQLDVLGILLLISLISIPASFLAFFIGLATIWGEYGKKQD